MAERLFFEGRNERAVMGGEEGLNAGQIRRLNVLDLGVMRVKSERSGIDTFVHAAFHTLCMNQT
jgi:hypothetical protein